MNLLNHYICNLVATYQTYYLYPTDQLDISW